MTTKRNDEPSMRPWVKSWRGGSTKWRALPLITRGLSRELETHADNEGRIELPPNEDPKSALWRLIGAHPRERQNLGKHLDALVRNETIVIEPGLIYFPNWRKYQGVKHNESNASKSTVTDEATPDADTSNATAAQPERNRGATRTQPRRNPNATATQLERNSNATAVAPNPAKSLGRKSQEGEEEREAEGDGEETKHPPSPSAPAPGERIKELEARYPAPLVAEARSGCALSRRNGRMSDGVWLTTLERLDKLPAPAVIAAMQTFVERYADGEKSERYLEGIARRNAAQPAPGAGPRRGGALPPSVIDPASAAETQRQAAEIFGLTFPEAANG